MIMTEQEVTSLLIKLADIGITGIMVRYDGAGDSGQIEEIQYCTEPVDDIEEIEDKIDYHSPKLNELNSDLEKAIEDLVYKFLLEDIEDWYNNEGGYGEVSIMVPSGNYWINNNIRIVDYECYTHEGSLIEKSAE
jgi:hypothetical protein